MTGYRPLRGVLLLCVAATIGECGFGIAPGPPYDFARLERVVQPVLSRPHLSVVDRQETGTDCDGMSCERPRLSYVLRSEPPATFETVQEMLSAFQNVTKPFLPLEPPPERDPAAPHRWACNGEVMGHGVQVAGDVTSGGDVFAAGAGTSEVIRLVVWADRLAIR